jgi:glycosyltransferase involved in cell wall biosynthesis
VDEIFDPRIEVTKVLSPTDRFHRASSMIRYGYYGGHVEWMKPAILATQQLLAKLTKPILMTRACPWVSNFVGYHCRHLAAAWVAHFSDPFPPYGWQEHWYSRLARPVNRMWARRIVTHANLVTVTCSNAIRYMEERSGVRFREKAMVLTHLAMPQIRRGGYKFNRRKEDFVLAHVGTLMMCERPDLLLGGVMRAIERHPTIKFIQYGHVDSAIRESPMFQHLPHQIELRHDCNLSPRDATDLREQADISVVADPDLGFGYSPILPSKFAHVACSSKPMLALAESDSAIAHLLAKYGGGEFVPFSNPEAVADAICRLYKSSETWARPLLPNPYHEIFSPEAIVRPFIARLLKLRVEA